MSILGIFLVVLPVIILVIGVLRGAINLKRALVCGSAVFFAGLLIYTLTMPMASADPAYALKGFFWGFGLMILSPWAAVVLGIFSGPRAPVSPIEHLGRRYRSLNNSHKASFYKGVCLTAKFLARNAAKYLRSKGHRHIADLLHGATKLF
ncbi:hypothetical protein EXS62_01065 [Candidatus Kaiserbacteria bacterium]|nr:hypothetical protein [Candidatus Kaiserbacteria bacterium]